MNSLRMEYGTRIGTNWKLLMLEFAVSLLEIKFKINHEKENEQKRE